LQHTGFFSFGENCASGDCSTPDDGLHWRPTRQPIVLDAWPVKPGPAHGKFTTVMQWDSYPAIEHNGRRYGMKLDSFAPYMDLPARAGPIFELAVGSATAPPALHRKQASRIGCPRGAASCPSITQRKRWQESRRSIGATSGTAKPREPWPRSFSMPARFCLALSKKR